jgi:hypothetical protein
VPPLKGCPISPNALCGEIWETQTLSVSLGEASLPCPRNSSKLPSLSPHRKEIFLPQRSSLTPIADGVLAYRLRSKKPRSVTK